MADTRFAELSDPSQRPFTTFRFLLEVSFKDVTDLPVVASFSEIDGLESTIEPKTIREGGRNAGPVHLLGPTGHGQLTLKRGMTTNFALWQWFARLTTPGWRGLRAEAEVVLLAADGATENARFILERCMPVRLKAPPMNAREGIVAIEEMSLVYETLRIKVPSPAPAAPAAAPAGGGGR